MTSRLATSLILALLFSSSLYAQDKHKSDSAAKSSAAKYSASVSVKHPSISGARLACQDGFASEFPCQAADLIALVDVNSLKAGLDDLSTETTDVWGWTDSATGKEYVIAGMNAGVSFVDISDAENPIVLGFLKTNTTRTTWRDIKVYDNHAFIVADGAGEHGMQIFDLTQLPAITSPPILFEETAHYSGVNSAHNVVINEDTGFAYIVGGSSGGETCGGGLHMVNIQDPLLPVFAGCSNTGYTHDAQCVVYSGPDVEHQGKEICIESSVKDIVITDVTDKSNPSIIGSGTYPTAEYVHQGWLTEDQQYFFLGDELDELRRGNTVTTFVWDFIDLDDPVIVYEYVAPNTVIDHNQYVRGNYLYQSNYEAGLRILDISDPTLPVEVAYFDTVPNSETVGFNDGSWSNYPYFESDVIAVTSMLGGLFLIKSTVVETAIEQPELPAQLTLSAPYPNPFDELTAFTLSVDRVQRTEVVAYDMLGRQVAVLFEGLISPDAPQVVTFDAQNLPNGKYIVRATGDAAALSRVVTLIR